jgi:hypothetical protein
MSVLVQLPDGQKTHFVQEPVGVRNLHMQVPDSVAAQYKGFATFYDDFTTIPVGTSLDGQQPTGKLGHWEDHPETTKSIKVHAGPFAVAQDLVFTYNGVCAVAPTVTNSDRFRIKQSLMVTKQQYNLAGSSFWSKSPYKDVLSGVGFYVYEDKYLHSTVFLYIDDAGTVNKIKTLTGVSIETWNDWELHAEKISATKVKVGVKKNNAWIIAPSSHTVANGFFNGPSRPTLLLRNSRTTADGGRCRNFLLDNNVDW